MSEQNVEIVRRLYEHFARGELGVAPDLYDPEIELSMIGSGGVAGDGRWRGLGEVLAANVEYLKRIWRVPHGSGKGSGAPIEHELGDMITLRKGKIVRVDFYWDRADALEAAAGVFKGHRGVERFFLDWLGTWTDFEMATREYLDAGDSVVIVFRQSGTGRESGVQIERDFFGVYDLKDSKVVRFRLYESREEALEAAGLSE